MRIAARDRPAAAISTGDVQAVVNPTQVSQVVLNLVTNAADAMNGKGEVTVTLLRADDLDEADGRVAEPRDPAGG